MKKGGSIFAIVSILSLGVALGGCNFIRNKIDERLGLNSKKKEEAPPVAPSPAPAAPTPVAPPPIAPAPPFEGPPVAAQPSQANSDRVLIEELNGYVDCLNRTSPRTNDSRARYLSWVNEATGPNCKEQYISYGLYTLYDDGIEKCNRAAERGRTGEPSLPELEKAATDLASAYAELVPLVKKAEDYFQQQDYKDDNCAKAKEMHPKLMQAFTRYRQAASQLQKGVDGLKGEVDKRELARLEQEKGRTLAWYSRNFSLTAKTLMRTIPEENTQTMNVQSYLNAYAQFDKDYQALNDYSTAHPDEGKGVFWYSAFEGAAKDFFTKAKFLKRDLAEGRKPDSNSLNSLVSDYNRLVNDANNVKF